MPSPPDDAIAVVGSACRLPGGIDDLDDLWAVLAAGTDLVGEVPPDRFPVADFVDAGRRKGRSYTAAGGFLRDVSGFDTSFFTGISPREAAQMDPQQRLLLEMAVEAMDDAGTDTAALEGSDTAVFIGCSSRDYGELQSMAPESGNAYAMSGTAGAIIANRLSHYFDWHGQSVTVDTACSSALTAVHQACEHLRSGHARLAVAGGINVLLNPHVFAGFSSASMLSPTGRCRPFSAQADGFTRAEGGGLVLLKRLADARADGDRVHAVILASGANNDGRTPGLALPSSAAQEALLRQVYGRAGLVPDEVSYLEAHGTGTPAGDPLEVEAIGRALGAGRSRGPLPIGSVKSNLGHMEAAAGMAGLFKALLVLRHRQIPATLHAEQLNPAIAFDQLNVHPVTRPETLDAPGPAVAGVNSFGFGGANAHVVLAAVHPAAGATAHAAASRAPSSALPIVVSARTPAALAQACQNMAEHLQFTEDELYDIAYTTTRRRTRHEHAACVWAEDPSQAAEALLQLAGGEQPAAAATAVRAAPGRVAFVFDGNGSQWAGMGVDLLAEPVFAAAVDEVDACLRRHVSRSVRQQLAAGSPGLERTEVAQPLLFAVQVGVVRLLEAHGIEPDAVVGHSVGEIAAAYVAGCLDLEQACRVVAVRSRAQAATGGSGRMAAVGLTAQEATKELAAFGGRLEIAGVNSPRDVTVAGDGGALAELGRDLTARGVFFRTLDLDYAFHSRHMEPVHEDVERPLRTLRPRQGSTMFASTVTGALLAGQRLDADYWWRNVRQPVLFSAAVQTLVDEGFTHFVEVGPHPVLATYLKRLLPAQAGTHATLRRDTHGPTAVRRAGAAVVAAGARPGARCFPRPGKVVSLPGYPWQRERHWNGAPDWWVTVPQDKKLVHPLLGRRAAVAEPAWHQQLTGTRLPWLADHQVDTSIVMPATAYLEAALAAGRAGLGTQCEVTDLDILRPLALPRTDDPTSVSVQTSLSVEDGTVLFASRTDASAQWTTHARGRVRRLTTPAPAPLDCTGAGTVVEAAVHYERTARAGLCYGPAFQVLTGLTVSDTMVTAAYRLPATAVDGDTAFEAHPVICDGALQAAAPLLAQAADGRMFLPTAIATARVWQQPPARGLIRVALRHLTGSDAVVDVTVSEEDSTVAVQLSGCRLRAVATREQLQELTTVLRYSPRPHRPTTLPPAPLPDPACTVAAAAEARAAFEEEHTDDYARFAPTVKTVVGHYAAAAFSALLPDMGCFRVDDLVKAGLRPEFGAYARLMAGLATQAGLLRHPPAATTVADQWRFTGVEAAPETHVQRLADRFPQWINAIALYARCGTHLTDILTGRTDARQVLFGEADRHLVASFYADSPHMRAHNHYARLVLEEALRQWPADRPLRVLEVGGGTGGLTAALLPVLPAHLTRYTFTDVTPAFFPRAQARFADYDFLDYRTLDLNGDPAEQGFQPGSFDLILAANVLHATTDLRATCTRLARLLDTGGQLLAVESHDEEILGPCFGLLPEYWSLTDDRLRSSPLLPRAAWPPLLSDCGFDVVVDTGSSCTETAEDHCLLVARRSTSPQAPAHSTPVANEAAPRTDGPWLIITDPSGRSLGTALTTALTTAGASATLTTLPTDTDTWAQPLPDQAPPRIVLLLGPDTGRSDADVIARAAGILRAAAPAAAATAGHTDPQLWLITPPTGLHPAPADTAGDPWAAALWGVSRVIANEHPSLTVRRVSIAPSRDHAADAERILAELLEPGDEDEVVFEAHGRFLPRLRALPARTRHAGHRDTYRLQLSRPGRNHRLAWVPAEVEPPGPGEVVVRVKAAALNYRDVMLAEGLLPPGAEPATPTGPLLGLECAGVVTATGPDVTDWTVGDRVFAFAQGAFASHVRVRTEQAGRIPDDMTFEQAATLPAVHLTVQHSLETLARLRAGDTVLVHGGAGGIGLAALAHARHTGARVIATAGTPAKRDLLHTLGAHAVFNSRDLSFAHQVREATGGHGVDVVLNSLAGEAIARSLECLKPGGRFIELGKRDIYANMPLLLRPFRNNLAYFGVDITRLIADAPEQAAAAFRTVTDRVADGIYRPLPHQSHPAPRVNEAVNALRHSRHLGKVVISFTDSLPVALEEPRSAPRLDADATYLVTGGLSGLGAATARHLATRGARHLALVSRSGSDAPEAAPLLADLRSQGVNTHVHATDITHAEAVRAIIREAEQHGRPVRGVVHAAMHLDDASLTDLTPERFAAVLAPKVRGAEILHELTHNRDLDFFVVYSSVAALIGNRHQAPYAAANLYMEALMRRRRDHGRPGLALAWGGISETGYIARTRMTDTILRSGLGLISPATALAALDRQLTRAGGQAAIAVLDWDRLAQLLPALSVPRFNAQLARGSSRTNRSQSHDLRRRLKNADSDEARLEVIVETLVHSTAHILQTTPDRVNPAVNLSDLGLDSLMGAELTVTLQQTFGCDFSMMELMAAATIDGIAHRVHRVLHG